MSSLSGHWFTVTAVVFFQSSKIERLKTLICGVRYEQVANNAKGYDNRQ